MHFTISKFSVGADLLELFQSFEKFIFQEIFYIMYRLMESKVKRKFGESIYKTFSI